GSMPPSSVVQNSASVSSIARRSTARLRAPISDTQTVDSKHSVGGLIQLLQARLGLREKRRRCAELSNAFLEERERRVELELLVLEASRDRRGALHARFETHRVPPSDCARPAE